MAFSHTPQSVAWTLREQDGRGKPLPYAQSLFQITN